MTQRSLRLACALLASALAAAAAAAESLGVLAVAEPPGPSAELAELTSQFRAVLAARTTGVLEPSELRSIEGRQVMTVRGQTHSLMGVCPLSLNPSRDAALAVLDACNRVLGLS